MKKKSINIQRLNRNQKLLLVVAIITLLLAVIVFMLSYNRWEVKNGGFGDLIAGTIGVGASFITMLLVIVSLEEQRKMNRQMEVHHLVESFNYTFDRFINALGIFSEADSSKGVNPRLHLNSLWSESNGIQETLSLFAIKRIRESTKKDISRLSNFCKDEDLIRVARTMNRLLAFKQKIDEYDLEAAIRINDDWETIPDPLKIYSGFYFGWLSELKERENENHENELIPFFLKQQNNILPSSIPKINILKNENPFKLNEQDFANQQIHFESFSAKRCRIAKIKLIGISLSVPDFEVVTDLKLSPKEKITISFGDLFGDKLQAVFYHFIHSPISDNSKIFFYQEIIFDYEGTEWIYENQIEFYRYKDRTASIIFQEITE